MSRVVQIALLAVIVGLLAGAGYGMWMFFGALGVGLLLGFTVLVVGIFAVATGGVSIGGGGSTNASHRHQSKGARTHEEE